LKEENQKIRDIEEKRREREREEKHWDGSFWFRCSITCFCVSSRRVVT